jgi:hypothetical protein
MMIDPRKSHPADVDAGAGEIPGIPASSAPRPCSLPIRALGYRRYYIWRGFRISVATKDTMPHCKGGNEEHLNQNFGALEPEYAYR